MTQPDYPGASRKVNGHALLDLAESDAGVG
jgi:hypothetical protein